MTPLQIKVLDDIREFVAQTGTSQTIQMLADRHGLSKGGMHRVVTALVDQGYLKRAPGKSQGLSLADQPDLRGAATDAIHAELARRGVSLAALNPRSPRAYGQRAACCAADSCGAAVRRGHIFCREHWFTLPGELRDRIMRTFGRRDVSGYQDAVAEARDVIDGGGNWERAA